MNLLGSIASPENGALKIGPLSLHMYGVFIALGVLAGVWLGERRWKARGGDPKLIADIALWLVLWGLVGARVYSVITDYEIYTNHPFWKRFAVWQGGLGIWGAVIGGALALMVIAKRRKLPLIPLMDTLGPPILISQAFGRWGNYFNQELFGRPSTWPWAVRISPAHRPAGYEKFATFQPTFLYECCTNVLSFIFIVWVERRFKLKRLQSLWLYIALNTGFRFFYENMRTDFAHVIGPLRLNAWVALILCVFSTAAFIWQGKRGKPQRRVDAVDDVSGDDVSGDDGSGGDVSGGDNGSAVHADRPAADDLVTAAAPTTDKPEPHTPAPPPDTEEPTP